MSTQKNKSLGEWLQALAETKQVPQLRHAEAAGKVTAAQQAAAACRENPAAYTLAQLREIAREVLESEAVLNLVPADSVDWRSRQVGERFILDHAAEFAAAGRVDLSGLTARVPFVAEPVKTGIFELTRGMLGLGPDDRLAIAEQRDKAEETLAWLDQLATAAATKIQWFFDNPGADGLNDMIGGLAALENAIADVAAGKF